MNPGAGCERTRDLAADLASGILDGAERSEALAHVGGCSECQRAVRELAEAADSLLLLLPEREPPPGFETRVLHSLGHQAAVPIRRRRAAALAVAALLGGTAASGAVLFWVRDDRRIASHYRDTLATARGRYFSAVPLRNAQGDQVGSFFGYEGRPSWIFVTVVGSDLEGRFRVRLETTGGRVIELGSMQVVSGAGGWGTTIPIHLKDLEYIRVVGDEEVLEGHKNRHGS